MDFDLEYIIQNFSLEYRVSELTAELATVKNDKEVLGEEILKLMESNNDLSNQVHSLRNSNAVNDQLIKHLTKLTIDSDIINRLANIEKSLAENGLGNLGT